MKFIIKQIDAKGQVVDWDNPCCKAMAITLQRDFLWMIETILRWWQCYYCKEKIEVERIN